MHKYGLFLLLIIFASCKNKEGKNDVFAVKSNSEEIKKPKTPIIMNLKIDEVIGQITDFMKTEAKTDTVVGETFQLGEFTCIPVIRVGMGFGTGVGEGDAPKNGHGKGGGAGAGRAGSAPRGRQTGLAADATPAAHLSDDGGVGVRSCGCR
mgnify:CR=1 FL=1